MNKHSQTSELVFAELCRGTEAELGDVCHREHIRAMHTRAMLM